MRISFIMLVLLLMSGCPEKRHEEQRNNRSPVAPPRAATAVDAPPEPPKPKCDEYFLAGISVPDGEVSFAKHEEDLKIISRNAFGEAYHGHAEAILPLRDGVVMQNGPTCVCLRVGEGEHTSSRCLNGEGDLRALLPFVELPGPLTLRYDKGDVGLWLTLRWEYSTQKTLPDADTNPESERNTCDMSVPVEPQTILRTSSRAGFQWFLSAAVELRLDPGRTIEGVKDCLGEIEVVRIPNPPLTETN